MVDSTGGQVNNRVGAQGYNYLKIGEILAGAHDGQPAISRAINGWENSPSHCYAIMTSRFKEVGIYFEAGVWAVVFGRPSNSS